MRHKTIEAKCAWHAVNKGQHVGAEVFLQLSELEQVVQNNLSNCIFLKHDDQALTSSARSLVANVGDAGDATLFNKLGNFESQVVWVHLIWQFGDYKTSASLQFFNVDNSSHRD